MTSIGLDRDALARRTGDAHRSTSLSNLALHLTTRFSGLGGLMTLKGPLSSNAMPWRLAHWAILIGL